MTNLEKLKAELSDFRIEENAAIVKQKSRDFFWYSPVLKRQLDHITADLVVSPESQDDVIAVMKACFRHDVPVTVRGAGTGNYGQAMPLSGGVVLDLSRMNAITALKPGSVVAEPGVIMHDIDERAREDVGRELRMHPSTHRTATIGGFIAGGSGGVGSIRWGGLRDLGNIIRLRVVTMEAEPQVLDLTGEDIHKVSHAYGTNGVITEVEVPLTAAHDWVDVLIGFDDFSQCITFANDLGNQDGILTKNIAVVAAPAPEDYFLRHKKFLQSGQHLCIVVAAPFALAALDSFVARSAGQTVFRSDAATADEMKGLPPAYELAWNHTTLRGLRVDPSITYMQILYPYPDHLERVETMTRLLEGEVITHLEFVRFDGNVTCFGLPIVRFSSEERLDEITRLFEDNGCPVFDAHRYTLEEGGMKQTDAVQLAFKRDADPKGLLNPGKMIAWEDPDFDYRAQKVYLFPGLQPAD